MRQAGRLDGIGPDADHLPTDVMPGPEHEIDRPSARDVQVLTVDDHASFRELARRVVDAVPGFRWMGEANSGEEAVAFVGRHAPDLVVMDVRMPGMGGLDAARTIASDAPGIAILLVSAEEAEVAALDPADAPGATFARKQDFGPALLRAAVSGEQRRGTTEQP